MNAQKIMPIIIGTAYLTSLMFFAFQVQYETIKAQSATSSDYMRGEKLKIAGSIDLLDRGQEFGVIDSNEYPVRKSDGYCVLADGVVGGDTPLAYRMPEEGCKEVHRPVEAPYVTPDGSEIKSLAVGGRK
ncbi:MAG: hypothetical protein ABEJ03_01005 [Candidatus Nanohaloarchaea archaeon]